MRLADKDMCNGTGHYFSLFWAMECPHGVPCQGCQGCGYDLFLKIWETVGQITYAYSVPGILSRRERYSRTIPGTIASMVGKEIGTAQSVIFQNVPNRRFAEAMLLSSCSRYDHGEGIDRAFTLVRMA